MRVLTDPVETGAATIALPQDVQAEAFDWPVELFAERVWHVARPLPEQVDITDAAALVRAAKRPLIVVGGGVHYSGAEEALRALCEATGIPVGETQAGKGSLPHGHPQEMGAVGSTGTTAANALAAEADLVIGVGTRWSDFTTASRTAFQDRGVRFVNINVAGSTRASTPGLSVVADAREALTALTAALDGYAVDPALPRAAGRAVGRVGRPGRGGLPPAGRGDRRPGRGPADAGPGASGAVNELTDPRDVVLCAAGSMPGDLHKLWRVRDRKAYHVEYGYSCMGYEVPGVARHPLADETRDVFAMVGDGGYLMMPTELVIAVQERVKVVVVLVQNHGFHSIGSLSESLGSQRFGTSYRFRDAADGRLDGSDSRSTSPRTPAASAPTSSRCTHRAELEEAITEAKARRRRRPDRHPRRDRPLGPRARQRRLVGRAGQLGRPSSTARRPPTPTYTDAQVPPATAWALRRAPPCTGKQARRSRCRRRTLRVGVIGVGMMGADHAERLAQPGRRGASRGGVRPRHARGPPTWPPRFDGVRSVGDPLGLIADARGRRRRHRLARASSTRSRCWPASSTASTPLCEKPLTMDDESSLRLVEAEAAAGRPAGPGGLHAPLRPRVRAMKAAARLRAHGR